MRRPGMGATVRWCSRTGHPGVTNAHGGTMSTTQLERSPVDDGRRSPNRYELVHAEYFRTREQALREELVNAHAGLARALAKRFARRGHSLEDITQVAFLGLLKAVDGFDPRRGLQFSTYAMPTILGELKRHMRNQSWGVRPPRRVHDRYLEVERTVDDLAQELGRRPTVPELADALGLSDEDVIEAIGAAGRRQLVSIETPSSAGLTL